jgi:hypothetical protein
MKSLRGAPRAAATDRRCCPGRMDGQFFTIPNVPLDIDPQRYLPTPI